MRLFAILLLLSTSAIAQLAATSSVFTLSPIRTGLPLDRMQPGVDVRGIVYAQSVGVSVFAPQGACFYADPATWLVPGTISGLANAGQSILDTDGSCLFVSHWSGALEHNIIHRVGAPSGASTPLHDLLFGRVHGFTRDPSGNYYFGRSAGLVPAGIYTIPAGQLATGTEVLWDPGVGDNAYLAFDGGTIVLADGTSLWRVTAGSGPQLLFTYTPTTPGVAWEWRGLVKNPFGSGFAFSVVELGATAALERVLLIDSSGTATEIASGLVPSNPDAGLSADHAGGLLVTTAGGIHRLREAEGTVTFPVSPRVAPGQSRPVVYTAPSHAGELFIPLISCTLGTTPLAGSPEPLHLAADPCTTFHLQDPSGPWIFRLAGPPGAYFGVLNGGGLGVGTVTTPASTPLGLDIYVHVTFLTVAAGGITGSHGVGTLHLD